MLRHRPGSHLATPKHRPDAEEKSKAAVERQRNRALPTNSARWRRIREMQLHREPLCEPCSELGRVTAADTVDHHDNDSANNSESNLVSMCRACHARKTVRHDGGFGRGE